MPPMQFKWLHCDGFRRFELEEPTYASLLEAITSRISSFQGGLCYTDAEGDKILITCDLDFADMVKYFRRKSVETNSELVIKIQTNEHQNGEKSAVGSQAVTSSTAPVKRKQKIEVIELLESADESNCTVGEDDQQQTTGADGEGVKQTKTSLTNGSTIGHQHPNRGDLPRTSVNEFMREMVKIDEICQFSNQKAVDLADQPGHSSWFVGSSEFDANLEWPLDGAAPTTGVVQGVGLGGMADNASLIGNNLLDLGHRMWINRKSGAISRMVSCTQCGVSVTNEHSSLKLHVNLHHLKLPIFSCKYCWKVEHKFSRANMIRHMRREHAEKMDTDFEHNSGKYRTQLYSKIDECFPEASERKRRTATTADEPGDK